MNFDVISPKTKHELLQAIADRQGKNFRFGAGFTDLILEIRKDPEDDLSVINLAQLKDADFEGIRKTAKGFRLGAIVTAAEILGSEYMRDEYPALYEAALNLASPQIREVATIGGNICTASPSGDLICALMAMNASCELLDTKCVTRIVPIRDFFTGVRSTVMRKKEVLQNLWVPANSGSEVHSGFIKIGTRLSMECSVVSLAWHIETDAEGQINSAGLAFGSAAPTVVYPEAACKMLEGKRYGHFSDAEKDTFAEKVQSYASPISDIRGSAWYRMEVLGNISKTILG